VRFLAKSHGFDAHVCGVCAYKISAPMYTVVFSVTKKKKESLSALATQDKREGMSRSEAGGGWGGVGWGGTCDKQNAGNIVGGRVAKRDNEEKNCVFSEVLRGTRGPVGVAKELVFMPGDWKLLRGLEEQQCPTAAAAHRVLIICVVIICEVN
jgi:hypothetical protein